MIPEELEFLTMQAHPLRPVLRVFGLLSAVSEPLFEKDVKVDQQELHRRGILDAIGQLKLRVVELGGNGLVGLRFGFSNQLSWSEMKGSYRPEIVVAAYGTAVSFGQPNAEPSLNRGRV